MTGPPADSGPPPAEAGSSSGGSLLALGLLVVVGLGIGFQQGGRKGTADRVLPSLPATPPQVAVDPTPELPSGPPSTSPSVAPSPSAPAPLADARVASRQLLPPTTAPSPEPEEPPPPPPPIPEGPPNPPLPEGPLSRLERVLRAPQGLAVNDAGKLVSAKKAPPEALRLASTDPRGYSRRMRALPGIADFHEWLAAGGRPEALGTSDRERLEGLDQAMAKVGLMPYFAPFLAARPAAVLDQPAGAWGALPIPARRFDGWAAAAARDFRALLRAVPARVAAVAKDPEGILGPPPPREKSAPPSELATGLAALTARLGEPEARRRAAAWMRPAVQRLRRAVYAAGRAMAEDRANREELALLFGAALVKARLLFHSEAAGLSPVEWLGTEPASPAAWCLGAEAALEGIVAQQAMDGDDPARWKAQPELWSKAQGSDPETKGTPAAAQRFRRALWRLVRFYVLTNASGAIKKLIFHYRQPLRDDPGQLGEAALLELGSYLAERPAFPRVLGPAEEGFTAMAMRRLLASDAKLARRAELRTTQEKLASLVRRPKRER